MIRVAIADDHEIVRRGLRMTILGEEDMELVGEAANGREAVLLATAQSPDVLLLDIQMPEMDGLAAAAKIRAAQPDVHILILTSFDADAKLYAALKAGVTGYLLKDTPGDRLVDAIRGAAQGIPQNARLAVWEGMGRVLQATLWRTRADAGVSGPIHAPRGPLE